MSKERFCYKPKVLERGDRIGLVNPVGEMNQEYAENAVPRVISYLERKGYQVAEREISKAKFTEGIQNPDILSDYYDPYLTADEQEIFLNPYTMRRRSFLALNNPSSSERADLFNKAVANCQAVFPLIGNRFGLDIVDQIDYTAFQEHRPIFVTFSAASAFLLHLHLRTNTEVFYGPHVHFLAGYENSYTISSFWNLLEQRNIPSVLKNIYSPNDGQSVPPSERIPFFSYRVDQTSSQVSGRLIPVFLFSLEEIVKKGKANFDPEGIILMVEADERNYDDCFAALELVHYQTNLSRLSALVLSSFIAFKPESAALRNELLNPVKIREFVLRVRKLLKDNVPVVYGFPMGHSKYKLTIPMGIQAELDIETGDITLKENPFSKI